MKVSIFSPAFPSVTETLPTDSPGAASSFTMVPMPCESPIGAPDAFERFNAIVSSCSNVPSSFTVITTVSEVSIAANVTVPVALK